MSSRPANGSSAGPPWLGDVDDAEVSREAGPDWMLEDPADPIVRAVDRLRCAWSAVLGPELLERLAPEDGDRLVDRLAATSILAGARLIERAR